MLFRHITKELAALLKIMPVVFIAGARQTGKTTLIEAIAKSGSYPIITFDDPFVLSNASRDPSGWLAAMPKPLIIDEVQRVPGIFLAIKYDVDHHREPGRYLLTGSANPLLLPSLGDSLAGRMGITTLYPFSQGEINKQEESFLASIFAPEFYFKKLEKLDIENLFHIFLKGGFPPIQGFKNIQDVKRWIKSYLQTMLERDIRDISNISGLRDFPQLFRLLATRAGMLLNMSDLARSLGLVNMTLTRYMRLLEALYFIQLLPSWHSNRSKRIVKAPKLQLLDTSILAQLIDIDVERLKADPSLAGQFLECFVFSELLKQKSWSTQSCELFHFRDGDYEVDFILEATDGSIVGIEVKSAKKIRPEDLRGLTQLAKIAGKRFKRGIILHLGSNIEPITNNLWAIPVQALWS